MTREVPIISLVTIDHPQNVLLPAWTGRRRYQAFNLEHVRIEQEMDHRLEIVRIGSADVRRHEHAMSVARESASLSDSGIGIV
jgi:hypothetical protein